MRSWNKATMTRISPAPPIQYPIAYEIVWDRKGSKIIWGQVTSTASTDTGGPLIDDTGKQKLRENRTPE